jgi:lysyl-tRNA synthetase class 2
VSRSETSADWRPACARSALVARAELNARIRRFFAERGVLEVETPQLSRRTGTDPNLQPFLTHFHRPGEASADGQPLYLQTSPEFAMKRLLAAGSGSIYQICKAYRNEECGRQHNPEFTLLEWYRVGFELSDLMDEVDELLIALCGARLKLAAGERLRYRAIFAEHVGADPLTASLDQLAVCAETHGIEDARRLCGSERSCWLDLLFSLLVQPRLGQGRISFVYDYPALLPSLARSKPSQPDEVERVEVFLSGVELGNGYHELSDPLEQERRFDADLAIRRVQGLNEPEKDERLLGALRAGLPDCCGIALGLDRILMLITGAESLGAVLAFPLERA